jgi:hypothetical protein
MVKVFDQLIVCHQENLKLAVSYCSNNAHLFNPTLAIKDF